MFKRGIFRAASVVILAGAAISGASPAAAGDWRHHRAVEIVRYDDAYGLPWYRQHPWLGTGPGHYYSYHPDHVPSYPDPLRGYPVPIYDVNHRVSAPVVRTYRVVSGAHVEWCTARYRSYDAPTDTYQPYHGPRRLCRSPFR
ncbi:BA14K family protein [Mesorhizobium sp. WSM2239]|uniref:Lectin-like protein BA14k n=2 Tax=unclassified Mesorhizobium TaxID=325217 RepID=A0AAU8D2Z1_9HYPH